MPLMPSNLFIELMQRCPIAVQWVILGILIIAIAIAATGLIKSRR